MDEETWGTHPVILFWQAIRLVYEELFALVLISVLTGVALLLVVPSFPAIAALYETARRTIEGRRISAGDWWQELKQGFGRAWAFGAVGLFLTLLLGANVWFYARQNATVWRYVAILWIWLLFVWGLASLYAWPLFVLQEDTRLWIVLRNAMYLAFLRPLHALVAAVLLLLVTALSIVLPIFFLVLPALWAVYTTLLTRQLVLDIHKSGKGDEDDRQAP